MFSPQTSRRVIAHRVTPDQIAGDGSRSDKSLAFCAGLKMLLRIRASSTVQFAIHKSLGAKQLNAGHRRLR